MTTSSRDPEPSSLNHLNRRTALASVLAVTGGAMIGLSAAKASGRQSSSVRVPLVLVHGVPETTAIWDPLIVELEALGHRDIIRLSPPGFGASLPKSFSAAVGDYREWLIGELTRIDTPVDLIGHDWGGGHVIGVAMTRPDLIRSWVTDIIGCFEPDYVWHPAAQTWQTPGKGEENLIELFSGSVDDRATRMNALGIRGPAARQVAAAQGPEMARAILALYRSTAQPALAEIGRRLPSAAGRPGLAIIATEDHAVGSVAQKRRGAARAGAQVAVLQGRGHWWMLEDPAQGARALSSFVNERR